MKQKKWMAGLIATVMVFGTAQAELVLVEGGKSLVPIVLAADATSATRQAATELADYLKKIGGVKPELVIGWPDPVPEQAIWIGMQAGLDTLFPEKSLIFQHPEEILFAANENHLIIAGRDRSAADKQVEFGTANAVYTFLQDKLDVRWLWPGPLGEDYIQREIIAFAPFEYRYHPQFRMRSFRGITSASWQRFQRIGLGSGSLRYNWRTAFTHWGTRYNQMHPEYLALQPDGTRNPISMKTTKVCMANPQVWTQWLDDVTAAIQKYPADNLFAATPSDGAYSGICVCDGCRAWDVQDGPIDSYRYQWRGLSQEYVAMSDRYATFINHLARGLKERFPDRDLFLYDYAYGPNMPAPLQTTMADNTVIWYVGHIPFLNTAERQIEKAQFKAWSAKAPHLVYRPNYWYTGGGLWGMPEVALADTIEDYRFLAEHHCIGLDIDTFRGHWATQGPQYYLLAQLAWNPMQDGQALLADYYQRGFGPAAAEINLYWRLMDEARAAIFNHPNHGQSNRHKQAIANVIREVFNDERLLQAEQTLNRAAAAATRGSEIHQQRVAFVKTGFEVVRKMLTAAARMDRVRETRGADAESVASAISLWQDIQALTERFPYAINYTSLRNAIGNIQNIFGPPLLDGSTSDGFVESAPAMMALPKSEQRKVSPTGSIGWKLVLHDRFDREELGPEWIVSEGDCSIRDGELVSPGITTLITARSFPGFHRIEYEAVTVTPKSFSLFTNTTQKPEMVISDLSALIQAGTNDRPITTGYLFQFGGGNNTFNRLLRASNEVWGDDNPTSKIVPNQPHRIIAENDEGCLRFIVDGNILFEGRESSSLVGEGYDRAGIYLYAPARIKEIKIYVKELDDGLF